MDEAARRKQRQDSGQLWEQCISPNQAMRDAALGEIQARALHQIGQKYKNSPELDLYLEEGINDARRAICRNLYLPSGELRPGGGPDDPEKFIAWCEVIVRRAVSRRWRDLNLKRHIPARLVDSLDEPIAQEGELTREDQEAAGAEADPAFVAALNQAFEATIKATESLSELSRKIVIRQGAKELEAGAVAAELGIPVTVVSNHGHRNRTTLHKTHPELVQWLRDLARQRRDNDRP